MHTMARSLNFASLSARIRPCPSDSTIVTRLHPNRARRSRQTSANHVPEISSPRARHRRRRAKLIQHRHHTPRIARPFRKRLPEFRQPSHLLLGGSNPSLADLFYITPCSFRRELQNGVGRRLHFVARLHCHFLCRLSHSVPALPPPCEKDGMKTLIEISPKKTAELVAESSASRRPGQNGCGRSRCLFHSNPYRIPTFITTLISPLLSLLP